jgi:signal transduction histidine kinase
LQGIWGARQRKGNRFHRLLQRGIRKSAEGMPLFHLDSMLAIFFLLFCHVIHNLPKQTQIMCDPTRLAQVLINLCSNAAQVRD